MDDDRLNRRLRVVETPTEPRRAFVEDLHERLAGELRFETATRATVAPRVRVRTRRRFGLLAIAAATLVGLSAIGSALVGGSRTAEQNLAPQPEAEASAPAVAIPSPRASPGVSPTPALTPSLNSLRSAGLVVFEHLDLPKRALTRVKYLAPDLSGQDLLPDFPGLTEAPTWSADGSRLAFVGYNPSAGEQPLIWETDAQGAAPRLVTTDCVPTACMGERDPAYAPDGRSMVLVRTVGSDLDSRSSVVAIRDADSGTVTELEATSVDAATGVNNRPRWSPDGSMIVFARTTYVDGGATGSTTWVVDSDGTGLRQLAPTDLIAGDPDWSPDGSRIIFSSLPIHVFMVNDVPNIHLYEILPSGEGLRQLDSIGGAGAPSWSGDGSQILFTKLIGFTRNRIPDLGPERPNLMVMNPDGSDIRPVTDFRTCCRWYWTQQPTP